MDIQALVDEYIEDNYGEVSNDDLAYHFYELGKKDAINALWHDAKEPPEIRRKYLVRYNDGKVNGSWERQSNVIPWKDVVKEHHFTHWCYVDDLLPKSE